MRFSKADLRIAIHCSNAASDRRVEYASLRVKDGPHGSMNMPKTKEDKGGPKWNVRFHDHVHHRKSPGYATHLQLALTLITAMPNSTTSHTLPTDMTPPMSPQQSILDLLPPEEENSYLPGRFIQHQLSAVRSTLGEGAHNGYFIGRNDTW